MKHVYPPRHPASLDVADGSGAGVRTGRAAPLSRSPAVPRCGKSGARGPDNGGCEPPIIQIDEPIDVKSFERTARKG